MHPRTPEDLIAHQVAQPGDQELIHERGLDGAPTPSREGQELIERERGRVWTKRSGNGRPFAGVGRQPDASKAAHVVVAQLAALAEKHESIVTMAGRAHVGPAERSGHAEVHQKLYAVRFLKAFAGARRDQPLAVAPWLAKPCAGERVVQRARRAVAHQLGIEHLDPLDRATGRVAR